jgi:hypothetical protein
VGRSAQTKVRKSLDTTWDRGMWAPGIRAARTGAGRLNKFEFPPRGTFLVPTKVAFADGHLFRE